METIVLTGSYTPGWAVAEATIHSKQVWCARHDYDLLNIELWKRETFCWQKLLLARQLLSDFETVVWLDADTLITNAEIAVSDVANDSYGIFASHDWNLADLWKLPRSAWFSAGNLIINRNAMMLLDTAINLHETNPSWHEQKALQTIVAEQLAGYESLKVLPGSMLNAVPVEIQPASSNPWTPHCLLAHLTSLDDSARLRWIREHQ